MNHHYPHQDKPVCSKDMNAQQQASLSLEDSMSDLERKIAYGGLPSTAYVEEHYKKNITSSLLLMLY